MSSVTEVKPPRHLVGLSDPGIVPEHWLSAASNNATLVKGSPSQLYEIMLVNTTSTIYYFKLYDKATAPAPATDVPVLTLPVPHATGAGASLVVPIPNGLAFSLGLGFSLVGAIADDDNTAAATGVAINLLYK